MKATTESRRGVNVFADVGSEEVGPVVDHMRTDEGWHLFVVGRSRACDRFVRTVHERFDRPPSTLTVVESGGGRSTVDRTGLPSGVTVHAERPDDLTDLCIHADAFLTRVRDADGPAFVWFDSGTRLLDRRDRRTAFRFVHHLCARVRQAGATGYYWFSPDAHDERTRATFRPLFDAVVPADDR